MKNLKLVKHARLLTGLLLGTMSMGAIAQLDDSDNSGPFFGKNAPGKWIIGVKVANIDPNIQDVQDADGIGIVLGYEFAKSIGGVGTSTFELEYIAGDDADLGGGIEYEADVLNAFFTYRSPGTLYYKLKAGLSYTEIDLATIGFTDDDFEDVSLAAGIGLGFRVRDYGVIELEYSQDSGDADLGIIGLNGLLEF